MLTVCSILFHFNSQWSCRHRHVFLFMWRSDWNVVYLDYMFTSKPFPSCCTDLLKTWYHNCDIVGQNQHSHTHTSKRQKLRCDFICIFFNAQWSLSTLTLCWCNSVTFSGRYRWLTSMESRFWQICHLVLFLLSLKRIWKIWNYSNKVVNTTFKHPLMMNQKLCQLNLKVQWSMI